MKKFFVAICCTLLLGGSVMAQDATPATPPAPVEDVAAPAESSVVDQAAPYGEVASSGCTNCGTAGAVVGSACGGCQTSCCPTNDCCPRRRVVRRRNRNNCCPTTSCCPQTSCCQTAAPTSSCCGTYTSAPAPVQSTPCCGQAAPVAATDCCAPVDPCCNNGRRVRRGRFFARRAARRNVVTTY